MKHHDSTLLINYKNLSLFTLNLFIYLLLFYISNKMKSYFVNDLVKNPVYGSSDIPLSSATENPMGQNSQPRYQDLTTDNGKI